MQKRGTSAVWREEEKQPVRVHGQRHRALVVGPPTGHVWWTRPCHASPRAGLLLQAVLGRVRWPLDRAGPCLGWAKKNGPCAGLTGSGCMSISRLSMKFSWAEAAGRPEENSVPVTLVESLPYPASGSRETSCFGTMQTPAGSRAADGPAVLQSPWNASKTNSFLPPGRLLVKGGCNSAQRPMHLLSGCCAPCTVLHISVHLVPYYDDTFRNQDGPDDLVAPIHVSKASVQVSVKPALVLCQY